MKGYDSQIRKQLRKFKDFELWLFLTKVGNIIEGMTDGLRRYTNATESTRDFVGIGIRFNNQGQFAEAIEVFEKALEKYPKDARALKNLGVSLNNQGRFDEAIVALDKAIEIDPAYCRAWKNKGVSLRKLGRFDEAIEVLDKAIEIANNGIQEAQRSGF